MSFGLGCVPLADRGLAYGDGVFETLRIRQGALVAWAAHYARLSTGCAALGLPSPSLAELQDGFESWRQAELGASDLLRDGVLKVIVTAGVGDRGYARPPELSMSQYWQITPPPPPRDGLTVALAAPTLAVSGCAPGLGAALGQGLKHLNRLPQVLSRAQWPDGADELLSCDAQGLIHGGTQSNVCWFEGGHWWTPPVGGSAIAGTVRAQLIRRLGVRRAPLSIGRLSLATAMVMTNAVRGVEPVLNLGSRRLDPAPVQALQSAWQALGAATAEDWFSVWQSEPG